MDNELPVLTNHHAKYFTHELTKRCASDSLEKLASDTFCEIDSFV